MNRKMLIVWEIALIFCVSLSIEYTKAAGTKNVVCYLASWAYDRAGNAKFTASDIDPFLCTHAMYAFVNVLDTGKVVIANPSIEFDGKNLEKFYKLKEVNPNLKLLMSVGGGSAGSDIFTHIAENANLRSTFVQDVVAVAQVHGFDGVDLDWEFPGQRGGRPQDKANFVTLVREVRDECRKHNMLITAAVSAEIASVDISYDVPALSQLLDIINVMTYDMHGYWDKATGMNAPLYPSAVDHSDYARTRNVEAGVRYWLQKGADPQKLALGLGTYGQSFTLQDPNNNKIGAPATGPGRPMPISGGEGVILYSEICQIIKNEGWNYVWDDMTKCPYAFKGDQWVGYDDARSIAIKVDFAKSLNLGGVMVWTIDMDDFRGVCGRKYNLLNTIKEHLGN